MKNLVEIDSNNISDFLENFVDTSIKIIDELDLFENDGLLASIPYGNIFSYAAKKFIEIDDPKEALKKSIALAHAINFLNGIKKSNLPLKIDRKEFREKLKKVKVELNQLTVEIDDFDINSFYENKFVKLYSKK